MVQTDKRKTNLLPRLLLLAFLILLGAGAYFIYAVVPQKVALTILSKSKIRQPLTESPKDYGISGYQDISFPTEDGITLSGWWLPMKPPAKVLGTVLMSHGVFKNRQQVLSRAAFLYKMGYQVLLFDQRGEGLSGDSPVSGGLLEAGDYLAAENFLQKHHEFKRPVVLFGFSLGAMSALRAAVKAPLVDGVIADSPLANVKSYVSRRTMGGKFAFLPGFLGTCLKDYDRLTGLTLTESDLDLTPVVQHLGETPVLYITGESDDLAKSDEVRQLFGQTSSHRRRLVYMPDSGHEETYKNFPVIYQRQVIEFLTDLRNGFKEKDDQLPAQGGKKGSAGAP